METNSMMRKNAELEFGAGAGLELGPDLSEEEWQETLTVHRRAMIEKLRAIFRQDLVVTKAQREEIERAAHGMWSFDTRELSKVRHT
jgi:hypothetical protein